MSQEQVSLPQWQSFRAANAPGSTLEGSVVSIVPFGAFLALAPGIEGLLHISETSALPEVGSTVPVRILAVDDDRKRVSLTPA
ncbi:S1 RNA-binding domain-containing protein [Nocardia uniformis]|uniref:S1 RNA-binding domain-containing protein n=1 Tax=Nocardia uniformis TaxID=53432 RepID=A0A849CH20_9NOCA|nr:S1 RNA-binding domain-containing protein [Nocardia uniformis]NNH75169.1 S1 RNA-binding domain-containing protein [Nocardia uniformis]